MKVLVVDDELVVCNELIYFFNKYDFNFVIVEVYDMVIVLVILFREIFDVVLLDIYFRDDFGL